jgi:hypothetical protein
MARWRGIDHNLFLGGEVLSLKEERERELIYYQQLDHVMMIKENFIFDVE